MKKDLGSFDLWVLAVEFQDLVGAYIDNLYQPEKGEFMLKLTSKKLGKRFLRVKVGKWIWLEKECDVRAQGQFSNTLKKHISNGRIKSVEQLGFERILKLIIQKRDEFELIIELIPPGNIVLAKGGVILRAFSERKWKDRTIKANQTYKPPSPRLNVPKLKKNEFLSAIKSSKKDLVRTLALDLNLGGLYAEEVCLRAGIDKKKKVSELKSKELENIYKGFKELITDLKRNVSPAVVFKNGKLFDVVPMLLRIYEGLEAKEFKSLNEALRFHMGEISKEKEPVDIEKERIMRIVKGQKEAARKWVSVIEKSQQVADLIYQHYEEVENILKQLRTDKTYSSKNLISFDPGKNTGVLRFDGEEIKIDINKTIHKNAQLYYEKVKKSKKKLEAVKLALKKSEKELAKASRRIKHKKIEKALPKPRMKKFWFERFRWFISSEDFLVIGGKDTKSNENIFRKHLKPGDRYVHAEISGAPSVVVKEGSKASEVTLIEACQFSLAHSKAWSSKIASGTAYWVKPEQVSKTPESGEYLPKGSFVIRGKRNYFHHLGLVLAVGEVEHKDEKLLMCSPPSVAEKVSKKYVTFRPGEKKKNAFAKELSKDFKVSVDDVLPILPPGDVEVVERIGF